MVFSFDITVPANTAITSPLRAKMKCAKGIIHRWYILFPRGQWCECRAQLLHAGHLVLPSNPDGFVSGDGNVLSGDDIYPILDEPYELELRAWNIDALNPHTLFITVFVKPAWAFLPLSSQFMDLIEREEIFKAI